MIVHLCMSTGDDAVKFESLPDDVIVAKAMAVLRSIFGDQNVPEVELEIGFLKSRYSFSFASLKKLMLLVGEEMSMLVVPILMCPLEPVEMIMIS